MPMRSSIFVFGLDLVHEGFEAVLDNVQQRAGVDAIALAATYHHARDLFPHSPLAHVHKHEGDIAWFAPRADHYASGLVPTPASAAAGADILAQACAAAGARGMAVDAWTIFLHNARLAGRNPDCATRNVYGDPYLNDLCPAHPRVRAYCRELASDLARYPVRRLLAESLHYRPLEHGEHHERYLIPLPPEARTLLGLCFCEHCRAQARSAGVAIDTLAAAVRRALEPVWEGEGAGLARPLLDDDAAAQLAAFVQVRCGIVTSLVAEVREALAGRVQLAFIDHAGAMSHVMLGTSADDEVTQASRKLGIDPRGVAQASDEFCALGYVDSPQRLQSLLASYRRVLGAGTRLSVALRPLQPDCRDAATLREKVAVVRGTQAAGVDFYHYAMMPLKRLDWIRAALPAGAGEEPA